MFSHVLLCASCACAMYASMTLVPYFVDSFSRALASKRKRSRLIEANEHTYHQDLLSGFDVWMYRDLIGVKNKLLVQRMPRVIQSFLHASYAKCDTELFHRAGLQNMTYLDYSYVLIKYAALFSFVFIIFGLLFSPLLAILMGMLGVAYSRYALAGVLKKLSKVRACRVESELADFLEVLVIGFGSGLPLDRCIEIYLHQFSGLLACNLQQCLAQYQMGFCSREAALQAFSDNFDSSLLHQTMAALLRTIHFGTNIKTDLTKLSSEVRAVYVSQVEERIEKAPVKMMLPTGTLILPAMLLLIMGPVFLEIICGL